MYLATIILWMDSTLSNFMSSLKRQVATQKLGSLEVARKYKVIAPVEAITINAPILLVVSRKRGRLLKVQASVEVG